ncbi:hypothetical protein GCM10008931_42830 [Oceanobacillus oncorhynchi subsp. oncorhynchi]|uniref:hypothetical protein n=1 Tax=Oceanobacillus oncorhynchi TaxID=545501 RepID=UPI0031D79900
MVRNYSDFHNTDYKSKLLRNGEMVFDKTLKTSLEAFDVLINDSTCEIVVQSTSKYNERRILFKQDEVHWGDLVEFDNEKWIVFERPFFNQIHSKSKMKLCNSEMVFEEWVKEIIGYDPLGNPIPGEEELKIIPFPCSVESISNLNTRSLGGSEINIPEGDMVVEIPYTNHELIEIGNDFRMFDDSYRISGIDKSSTDGQSGILILVVSRTQNKT